MRGLSYRLLIVSFSTLALGACGDDGGGGGAETESGTETEGTETDTSTNTTTPSTSTTQGSDSATSGTGAGTCEPGTSIDCACPDGSESTQTCNAQGDAYLPCQCGGGSDTSTSGGSDTSTSGGSGSSTSGGGSTSGASTTGGACADNGPEPNEAEDDATDHGNLDCDAGSPGSFSGTLNGDSDVDWHSWHGTWVCGQGDPEPNHVLTASDNMRLCAYAECDAGTENLQCLTGTDAQSPNGLPGCCNDNGDVQFYLNCMGTGDESATVYARLDNADANACSDYSVEYDFNPG